MPTRSVGSAAESCPEDVRQDFCSTSTSPYNDHPAPARGQRRCPQHEAVDSRLTAVLSLPTAAPRELRLRPDAPLRGLPQSDKRARPRLDRIALLPDKGRTAFPERVEVNGLVVLRLAVTSSRMAEVGDHERALRNISCVHRPATPYGRSIGVHDGELQLCFRDTARLTRAAVLHAHRATL
jgi:hypothetical protein